MRKFRSITGRVLDEALKTIGRESIDVFTFALYFDHESSAISVCVDTLPNSERQVFDQNQYSQKHFWRVIASGKLSEAALWQSNVGRNLSLGDFAKVNVARVELHDVELDDAMTLDLVESLRAREDRIAKLTSCPHRLLICCSTPDDEVGLIWSASVKETQH